MIKNDDLRCRSGNGSGNFLDLAAARIQGRIGPRTLAAYQTDDLNAGTANQFSEFLGIFGIIIFAEIKTNQ